MDVSFVLAVGGPTWREADSRSRSLVSQTDPRPPLTCRRVWGGAQVLGAVNGLQGEGTDSNRGVGNGEPSKLPRCALQAPPGKSPVGPPLPSHPVLAPPRESQTSGALNTGFPEPSAGAPASDPGYPEPTGNPGEGSSACRFDAAPFQPEVDRTSWFPLRAEVLWVPPRVGAPRGPQGPQERSGAFLRSSGARPEVRGPEEQSLEQSGNF